MFSPNKILVLESNSADVELIQSSLQNAGMDFSIKSVDNKTSYIDALSYFAPDVILANHCVNNFSSVEALELCRAKKLYVPFILVTNSVDETFAVKVLKLGASDYILKGNVSCLNDVIQNALHQKNDTFYKNKIKESEDKYHSLFERASDGISIIDAQGNFIEVNESYCRMLGYSKDELAEMTILDVIPEKDITEKPPKIKELIEGQNVVYERTFKRKDGTLFTAEINSKMTDDGSIIGFIRNISARKEERDLLQKSLNRNTAFLNAIPDLIFIINRSGVFTDFHAPAGKATFTPPEHFLGKNIVEIFPAQLAEETTKNIVNVLENGEVPVQNYQLEYPDGIHEFEARYAAINNEEVLAIVRDTTDQKIAEQKIERESALSESIINSLPGIFYMGEEGGHLIRWNKNFETVTGYNAEEISSMSPIEFYDGDERQLFSEKAASVFAKGEDSMEAYLLLKSGEKKYYYFTGKAIEYGGKNCMVGVGIDLSERKKAEAELSIREERFRALTEQASDGISIADENYQFTEVNSKFCKMLGYSRDELLNMKMFDFPKINPGDKELRFEEIRQGNTILVERQLIRKDKTIIPVEISATFLENKYYLSFVRDITGRKKTNDLLEGEKKVMEMIATGQPLNEILDSITLNYESISNDTLCSISFLNEQNTRLIFGAGTSLPGAFNTGIDGEFIGPEAGSCGTAAYRKERVIVSDIASDPLWVNYRKLALDNGLKACWSIPIFDKDEKVLGTFANYSRQVRYPDEEELRLVDRATNLVRIAWKRNQNEKELKNREEKFRTLVERVSDAFVALDSNWNYTYVNKKAGELFNRNPAHLIGKHIWTEFPEGIGQPFHHAYEKAMREQKQINLSEYYPPYNRWFENTIYPSPEGISVYFKDVTPQKLAEQKIIKNSRLYFFISQFNQMIIHADDELKLFREACDIAVQIGNFRMAWIGKTDESTKTVVPVMHAGNEDGYLTAVKTISTEDIPEGRGVTGTAIRNKKYIVCNDFETDIMMAPWKSEALPRGYLSCISIPILKFGKAIGAFTLYADTKDFFNNEEILLLVEATGNVSFALENIEKESFRKEAEAELKKSNNQFQNLVENISGVYWVNNLDTYETLYISPSYEKIWGRKCEDLYKNPADFINSVHPEDKQALFQAHKNVGNTYTTNITYRIIRPDNKVRWISAKTNVVTGNDGIKLEYGYAEDITEMKIVEKDLAESENRLKTILQNEPECVKLIDRNGELIEMNPAGLAMIEADSLDKVKGKKMNSLVHEPYLKDFNKLTRNVFKGIPGKLEFEITGIKGTHRWLETHAVPLKDAAGKIISLLGVTRDITERKIAEEKEKQLTLKVLKGAEIANFGFIDWDLITNEVNLSQQVNDMYGITDDLLDVGKFIQKVVHPDDAEYVNKNLDMAIKGLKEYNIDHRIVRPDGITKWINARAELSRDEKGNPTRMFGTILDITENKNAELQIKTYNEQLRDLTTHLESIREEERKRIAREIHDELGQQLTAVKMDIAWIDKNTTDKKLTIKNKLKNIIGLLDGSNQSVRKILNELRPGILDNNGLIEAMEWHLKQFSAGAEIKVVFDAPEQGLKIDEKIASCIYRVFQESLTNIMRYARAKKVIISLKIINEAIVMTIEDDGIGFKKDAAQSKGTFGILGMRERVRSLNGKFELIAAPGAGTKIIISLPGNIV